MSLEAVIQENTAALQSFSALLAQLLNAFPIPQAEVGSNNTASHTVASPQAQAQKEQPEVADQKPAAVPESPTADPDPLVYDDIRSALQAVALAKGREAALAVLAQFGATNAQQLQESQWEAVYQACDAQL